MNGTHLLAQIKLRETRRQRDRLHALYDSIEARFTAAGSPLERLRALHAGLREVTFAQKPLHPDVADLDALFLADELGTAPPELIADRTRLLERELTQGRLRAEFTYAFGLILSEWTAPTADASTPAQPEPHPLPLLWEPAPAINTGWLDRAWQPLADVLAGVVAEVQKFARTEALAPVGQREVTSVLSRLQRDSYASPELRRQAAGVLSSPTQINEYAGALTILLNNLDEWEWPEPGLPLRAVWFRIKYRPYLHEDLITALFLQVIGLRWGLHLRYKLAWPALHSGKEADPGSRLFPKEPRTAPLSVVEQRRLSSQAQRFLATLRGSGDPESAGGYGPDALLEMLQTIETELRFASVFTRDRPLYVLQTDLRDFYPSLSHGLILDVLGRLGVSERWRQFFGKFLSARVRYRGQTRSVSRGLILEHLLADVLAECVLVVLDLHLIRSTGLRRCAVIDDLWLFSAERDSIVSAWREQQAFCRACGLEINEAKSGAVCFNAPEGLPEGLPAGRPRWGLLRLQPDGAWAVDEPAFAQQEDILRRQIAAQRSVLGLVSTYNGQVNYVLRQLALSLPLRGEHHRRVGARLDQMHESLLEPGHGLAEEVRRRLSGAFADARLKERGLPAALLYWPITAGGLALSHPLLHVAAYLRGRPSTAAPVPPDRDVVGAYLWRRSSKLTRSPLSPAEISALLYPPQGGLPVPLTREDISAYLRHKAKDSALPGDEDVDSAVAVLWGALYDRLVLPIELSPPPALPAMENLVNDFIKRGGEVSGRDQAGLSPYWRWVVYAYGPSLLEALGTFRFLMTELVPLELILEQRGAGPELEGKEPTALPPPPLIAPPPDGGRAAGEDIPF